MMQLHVVYMDVWCIQLFVLKVIDGNTEVFYFKNATATFSAFTHEPEVVKF